jgi:hypothetical protein
MYNNETTKWFSQTLLNYKDKVYGTDGYLRISISTNTSDYKYFNPPSLKFSITNNYQKSYNINFQNAQDLYKTFKKIIPQLNSSELDIQRKYQKDTIIHFSFKIEKNNNERIVAIEIRSGESDFARVIVPLEVVFEGIASCVRMFIDTYMDLCHNLLVQSIQTETTQIIHQLPNLIKGISSQIVAQTPAREDFNEEIPIEVIEEASKTEATIADLDKFLGSDMQNITIVELDKEEKKAITEVKSLFVENIMKNDLENLEILMTNYSMNPAPLLALADEFKNKIQNDIDGEDFSMLPSVKDDDLKSLVYMSKMFCSLSHQNHINTEKSLPFSVPVFRYNPSTYRSENIDIALDLLLMNLYVRTLRRRLESKRTDINQNKALFNLQLRCFTDVFVFSFLDKIHDSKQIPSIISSRFEYYQSIGVFDKYIKLLEESLCLEITKDDILAAAIEASEKVIGKSPYINDLHSHSFKEDEVRIDSKNPYTLEQIINEVLPLEISMRTGKDINSEENISELRENYPITDEVLKAFNGKKLKDKKQEIGNLERIVNFYIDKNEIPDKYKEDFIKYIKELGNNKVSFKNFKFPIEELGDNIIKILYLWDPNGDPKIVKNYKHFFGKVENEIMERSLIITQIKTSEEPKDVDDNWNFG